MPSDDTFSAQSFYEQNGYWPSPREAAQAHSARSTGPFIMDYGNGMRIVYGDHLSAPESEVEPSDVCARSTRWQRFKRRFVRALEAYAELEAACHGFPPFI